MQHLKVIYFPATDLVLYQPDNHIPTNIQKKTLPVQHQHYPQTHIQLGMEDWQILYPHNINFLRIIR